MRPHEQLDSEAQRKATEKALRRVHQLRKAKAIQRHLAESFHFISMAERGAKRSLFLLLRNFLDIEESDVEKGI